MMAHGQIIKNMVKGFKYKEMEQNMKVIFLKINSTAMVNF